MTKTSNLALTPDIEQRWTPAQIELIRAMCAKNCSDDEFKVLLYVAYKYDLDPLTKQIYAQKYASWGDQPDRPAAIIITYAGMQEIANRGNMLDGLSSEVTYAPDGSIQGARSTLWKKGCSHPFHTEVDLDEYIQYSKNKKGESYVTGLWATKPKTMIRKVACAQNIRQAFSLGQMYSEEEMPQVEPEAPKPELPDQQTLKLPVAQPPVPEPEPVKSAPIIPKATIEEIEKYKRIGDAAAIDLSYGVQTVNDSGEFLPITSTVATSVLGKMIGATNFAEAARIVGIKAFEGVVKDRYPDAIVQAQKFSATLHFVYNWAYEQAKHKAEREAARVHQT